MVDRGLGPKIRALRDMGRTYGEIAEELGCSKGTVSYHVGDGQKTKHMTRQRAARSTRQGAVEHKMRKFLSVVEPGTPFTPSPIAVNRVYSNKIRTFSLTHEVDGKRVRSTFDVTAALVLDKLQSAPVCYLTGDPIDPDAPSSFEFDHIVPRSRGGENTLENLGFASREANRAKGNLTLEEFISLCEKVVKNFR